MPKAEPTKEQRQKLHSVGERDVTKKSSQVTLKNEINKIQGGDEYSDFLQYYLTCPVFKKN